MSVAERVAGIAFDYSACELEQVTACNLCGSARHAEAGRRDRYGFPAVYRVCLDCGLGFLSPRPTAGEYAAFYRDTYRLLVSAYHGRRIDAETVQDEQLGYAAELVSFLRGVLPITPRSILDIGGSTGVVASALCEAFGAEATVLDPAPDELRVAEAGGLEAIAGVAEDFDAGERRWDLVLLCQTIDHLLDVRATLTAVRRMLAGGGHIFADVLDVGFMLRRRGTIEGAVKIDHPYYLTRETALAYFGIAGLEPVAERLSHDGHWGFVLRAGEVRDPDLAALASAGRAHLDEVWRLRAASG